MIVSADKIETLPPSFLLVGHTGSGKSHLVHKLIENLEANNSSKQLKYALFDMKKSEFIEEGKDYKQGYLLFGIVSSPELAIERLEYLSRIADMRLRMNESEPALFIYIDECDAAYEDRERFDTALLNILDKAGKANMRIVYATSRVSDAKCVSDRLMKGFKTALVGSLSSKTDADRFGVSAGVDNQFEFRKVTTS
jgi:DNA segregation ATPase FtsK/SpoIIIE-like protein